MQCNILGEEIPLCIPTFLNDQQSFKQSKTGQGRQNATCGTHLAISNLVSDSVKHVNRETNTFTTVPVSAHESAKIVAPTSNKQNLKISGVDSLREKLLTGGLSETASQLISRMRGPGLISNYNSPWAHCVSWCNERKVDPFRCNIDQIVNHLSFLFDPGVDYRTIGCHRSTISAYHEYIDGKPVGQHPKVYTLLKVVFNKMPPQPRYVFIWDVQIVIKYIKSEWRYSEGLSDKLLTLKLVMLMALTSAYSASAIHHLDIRYMVKGNGKYVFKFHRLHKSWRCEKPIPSLEFHEYSEDKKKIQTH